MNKEQLNRMKIKKAVLDLTYSKSFNFIKEEYKDAMRNQMVLDNEPPEDLHMKYFNLGYMFVWFLGEFKDHLPVGYKPRYITDPEIKAQVIHLHNERQSIFREMQLVNTYVSKVLTEATTLDGLKKYLPVACHNIVQKYAEHLDQGEPTPNEQLDEISPRFFRMMNERIMINLLGA